MSSNRHWLYMPIETKVRELYGKVLLASFAAINGFNVVIGSKKDINSRSAFFPKGVVFNVGLAKNMAKNSRKYKDYGHTVVSIDEEGLVTLNDDLYIHHRISKEALDTTDIFFAWGKKQANLIIEKNNADHCKIFITGNPRFDMLRPEYRFIFNKDINEIRKKNKKFILVNTNFGHGNHFAGNNFLLESFKEKGWMNNPEDKDFFMGNIKWQKEMFKEFKKAIPEIARKFSDYNIIIRPHPSENHDPWKKIAKNYSNVFVVHQGNVIPWLMAADVLVHNGCTTAVEAFVLGTKAVAYRPFIVEEQETELPNKISVEARNLGELINNLQEIINNHNSQIYNYDEKKKYLDYFLSGMKGENASEKISSVLREIAQPNDKKINIFFILLFDFFEKIMSTARGIIFKKSNNNLSLAYQLHKNPGLAKKDFQELIEKFSKINKDFSSLKVKRIGMNCYQIYEDK